ncbi:MAG: hypothetical protein AAF108_11865 [Planctomycetota bacterium]
MKGINPIEEHFDKGIVGLAAFGVVGVLAWQFLLAGNMVEVGGQKVPLAEAYRPAERVANRLQAELEESSPAMPEVAGTESLETWTRSLGSADRGFDASGPAIARAFGARVSIGESGGDFSSPVGDRRVAAFEPVTPARPTAYAFRATVDPDAAAEIEGLSQYLPSEQPFDTLAVSAQSTFDGSEMRRALERDPDGNGPLDALPRSFWADTAVVLGVEFERQRLVDGVWSETVLVPGVPGLEDLIDRSETVSSVRDLVSLSNDAAAEQQNVLTPLFPPMIAGEAWQVPTEVEEVSADPRVVRLRSRRRSIDGELERLNERLEALAEREQERDEQRQEKEELKDRVREDSSTTPREGGNTGGGRTGGGRSGGGRDGGGRDGGGRAGGGRSGGGRQGGGRTVESRDLSDPLQATEAQIEQREEDLAELEEELEELLGEDQGDDSDDRKTVEDFVLAASADILDEGEVTVWTHDLTVAGGETYRYRARLVMPNPVFGREGSLAADQAGLSVPKTVRSAPSPWSAPVETSPDRYIFVTSASGDNEVSGASASVEMYGFFYGFWRKGQATVRPGDALIVEAALPNGLRVLNDDLDESEDDADNLSDFGDLLTLDATGWLADVVAVPVLGSGPLGRTASTVFEVVVARADGRLETIPAVDPGGSSERLRLLASVESGLEQGRPDRAGGRGGDREVGRDEGGGGGRRGFLPGGRRGGDGERDEPGRRGPR